MGKTILQKICEGWLNVLLCSDIIINVTLEKIKKAHNVMLVCRGTSKIVLFCKNIEIGLV